VPSRQGMLRVFAEFERSMIQERVRAGLARARAAGAKLGRPRIPEETEVAYFLDPSLTAVRDKPSSTTGVTCSKKTYKEKPTHRSAFLRFR
jgi:DNA invertase Pin-like site-specific DNA recombinase